MSDSPNPLLERVQNQLRWPAWETWSERVGTDADLLSPASAAASTGAARSDHASRSVGARRRLELARTIEQGGPYLEVFRRDVLERLEAENGRPLGPLASFTFAIKDLIALEGRPMRAGSVVRADAPPEPATAPMVRALEAQGALALGTVALHEFAFGVTGVNPAMGTAPNPTAPGHITGGSSSGSAAAVADGSARISIGTDTGGSIRGPASFCGVVGYKPTFGLYPTAGVFPLSGTLDHVGLFASTVADIATVHGALGYAVDEEPALPQRIGVVRADVFAADPEVAALVDAAVGRLRDAGCEVTEIDLPDPELVFATSTAVMFSEAAAIHAPMLAAHGDRYGDDIRSRLELGAALTSTDVATAHEMRRRIHADVAATLTRVDVIVGTTTPMTAPTVEAAADPGLPARIVANTRLGNVVGLPALSLPLPSESAPVGLQLMGRTDRSLLAHAASIEAAIAPTP